MAYGFSAWNTWFLGFPNRAAKKMANAFADIKGSMELIEDLDPEDARAIVDSALKLMMGAVQRYDGYVAQSTGDGGDASNVVNRPGARMTARGAALWGHRDFMRLWVAQSVSGFGARIAREGLPMVAILVLRAGPQAMGLLAAAGLIAYAVAGLGAGVLVDRAPKRPLMIAADLGRALVMLAVPLAAVSGWLTLAGVFIALALISALSAIFEMADHAFLPSLIDASQLVDGNAKLGTTDAVAEFGGPALAGVLVQVLTAPIAVGATAATYLASAVCLTAVRTPEMLGEAPEAERPAATPADFDVLRGVRAVLAHPIVRPIWLMSVARDFFGWFYGALYAFYALEVLRLSPAQVGVSVAAGGLGRIVGAPLAPMLVRRLGAGPMIVVTGFAAGAAGFLIPLAGGAPLVALTFLIVAQLFGDALQTAREIGKTSLRQALIPATELGRAAGAFAAAGLAGVAGAWTGGSLGAAIGARETLFITAAGGAVVPLIGLLSPLWRARVANLRVIAPPRVQPRVSAAAKFSRSSCDGKSDGLALDDRSEAGGRDHLREGLSTHFAVQSRLRAVRKPDHGSYSRRQASPGR